MIDGTFLAVQKNIEHQDRPGQALHIRSTLEKDPMPDMTCSELAVYYLTRAGNIRNWGPDVSSLPARTVTRTFFKLPDLEVSGIEEAERIFLREIESRKTVEKYDAASRDEFVACPLSTFIMRRCNLIYARTRRGLGNIVLVSDDIWERVEALLRNPPWPWTPHPLTPGPWAPALADQNPDDRFRYRGLIDNKIEVYSTSIMPTKGVAVIYKGNFADGGGVYLEQDGKGFLSLNKGAEDYIEFFDIVGLPETAKG